METVLTLANRIMTAITLATALGVFMHDGRVDKAATTAMYKSTPTAYTAPSMGQRYQTFVDGDAHTHPDHNAARSSMLNHFAYQSPSVPPRDNQKRHLLREWRSRGHFAFDNANLPILT